MEFSTSFVCSDAIKAHLTSHSRMSGSRCMITPSLLSGLWRSFLYSSSVFSCYLFLISSASVRLILFLSFIVPIFAWNVPLVLLIFLKKIISSLSHSIIFLYFFALITEEGFLSLLLFSVFKWVYLSFSPLPFTSLLFSAICKAYAENNFAFFISFSWGWFWSLPLVQYHEPLSIVLQVLYQI